LRSSGDSLGWLSKRLRRIYVSYWFTLVAILAANLCFQYKPMSWTLVISQFLGIAYFTHRGQMIGVTNWFISLILLCYVIAAFVRWERRLLPVFVAITLGLMHREDPKFAGCVLAFMAGGVVAMTPKIWNGALGVAGVCLMATATGRSAFAYPLAGSVAIMVGTPFAGEKSRVLALASECTYEFFLVHGPIYLGLSRVMGLDFFGNLISGRLWLS